MALPQDANIVTILKNKTIVFVKFLFLVIDYLQEDLRVDIGAGIVLRHSVVHVRTIRMVEDLA
jgi:hypothetical protein